MYLHFNIYIMHINNVSLLDSNVDPSLQNAQRKLKKAKLTDELNEKLAHRPGPLELVEQSILEVDDPIKVAIKGTCPMARQMVVAIAVDICLVNAHILRHYFCHIEASTHYVHDKCKR